MKFIIFIMFTALLSSCADSGYHPHYIISKDEMAPVQEDVR